MSPNRENALRAQWAIVISIGACGPNADKPNHISLQIGGSPKVLSYRDGDRDWTIPEPLGAGADRYNLWVDNDYVVVAVCVDSNGRFSSEHYAATYWDGDEVTLSPCASISGLADSVVVASGTMLQAGRVFLDGSGLASTNAPWDFVFQVRPGTYSLIASNAYDLTGDQGRILIRRNLTYLESTPISDIDLATEGVSTVPASYSMSGLMVDDAVTTTIRAAVGGPSALVSSSGSLTAQLIPGSYLQAEERQILDISAISAIPGAVNDIYSRGITTDLVNKYEFELLPPVSDVTVTNTGASWEVFPARMSGALDLLVSTGPDRQRARATNAWIEQCECSNLGFDSVPPEYRSEWRIESTSAFLRLSVIEETDGVNYWSSLSRVRN